MAEVKVIGSTYTVDPLYQWDLNQVLKIYGLSLAKVPEIHYTNDNMDRAIVRQASMDAAGVITADIPNSLLQQSYPVKAYVCTYEGTTFQTLYKIEIPVKARTKPADYTLIDDPEVYSFNALENQVVNALSVMQSQHSEAMSAAKSATTAYNAAKADYAEASERMDSLADKIEGMENGRAVVTLTHTKSGTVHALTGLEGKTGLVPVQFQATASFAEGDTFTIDGTAYTAQPISGGELSDGFFVSGAVVSCSLDVTGTKLNFKGGGGITLPALSNPASAAQILNTYQALNGDGNAMTGTAGAGITNPATAAKIINGYQAMLADGTVLDGTAGADIINPAAAAQILSGYQAMLTDGSTTAGTYVPYYKQYLYQNCTSSSKDTTCTFTATGGTIDLAVCWLTDGYTITNILQYVGLYYNGNIIQAKCGSFTLSKITSVSGHIVTAVCDSTDVSNVGNSLRMHCVIFSH